VGVVKSVPYTAAYDIYVATPSGHKDVVCGGTYGACTSNSQCNAAEGYFCRLDPYGTDRFCDDGTGASALVSPGF
jgi:hypothetical protein